jgi:hypothetical protein
MKMTTLIILFPPKIMLPPRNLSAGDRELLAKEDLEGVALAFPDSGSAGNTNTGNASRRCLMKEHLRERLVGTVPEQDQGDFRLVIGVQYFG